MTWTAPGAFLFIDSGNMTVNNQGIGNLLVVEVINYTNSTVWCTSLSGGGATWVSAGVKFSGTTHAYSAAVFLGTVTATGAGTVTPAWSGTAPAGFEVNGHEFASTAGAWVFDVQGNLDSAGTASWPSLTPGAGGELYFGSCATGSSTAGSTAGYVYSVNGNGDATAYNLSCPAGTATFPVWGDTNQQFGIAILVAEVSAALPPAGIPDWLPYPPGWFPGSDKAATVPGGIPFEPLLVPADPSFAIVPPSLPEAAGYRAPLLPPGWFPGADKVTTEPGGIPFAQIPAPADPSLAVLPPPAPPPVPVPLPLLGPGWYPGAPGAPDGIPFYVQPLPDSSPALPGSPVLYITGASADGTHFVDQHGAPRLFVNEDAWYLMCSAGRYSGSYKADITRYMSARSAQGYTAVEVSVWSFNDGSSQQVFSDGRDQDGTWPFNTTSDPTTGLNDVFWARRDYLLATAAAYGITVVWTFTGSVGTVTANNPMAWNMTTAGYTAYGTALGNRYKNTPNIMWICGDEIPVDLDTQLTAFITALRATGDTHLFSIQNGYPTTSRINLPAGTGPPASGIGPVYAQYNWVYDYNEPYNGVIPAMAEPAANGSTVIPVVWSDGFYLDQGTTGTTSQHLERNNWWWALSSGACGVGSGDGNVYEMLAGTLAYITSGSAPAGNFYTAQAGAIAAAFSALPGWWHLVPDLGTLVTAGRGTFVAAGSPSYYGSDTDPYITVAWVTDGSLAVIYFPNGGTITVDQTRLGAGYTAQWMDPATGTLTGIASASTYNASTRPANSQGDEDWVLVLQGPSVSAAAPGLPDYMPLPPGWFPGADKAADLPGGIPFWVIPQPVPSPLLAPSSAAVSSADTAHGAEAASVQATLPGADSGHGTEGSPARIALSGADTAHGTEAGSVHAALAGSDTAHGTEAASVSAAVPGADSGHGLEAGSVHAALAGSDTAHAAEGSPARIGVAGAESGSALEGVTGVPASLSKADTAHGADAQTAIRVSGADSAAAAEAGSVHAALSSADTAHGAELGAVAVSLPSLGLPVYQPYPPGWFPGSGRAVSLPGGIPFYVIPQPAPSPPPPPGAAPGADTAHAADLGSVQAALSGADTGHGLEAASVHAALSGADTGHAAESGFIRVSAADVAIGSSSALIAATLSSADTAHGPDAAQSPRVLAADTAHAAEGTPGIRVTGSDTAHGADSSSVHAAASGADTAHGTEGTLSPRILAADIAIGSSGATVAASLPGADTAHAADVGIPPGGLHSSADTVHAVESAFYYILGTGDTAQAAEGTARVRVSSTDKTRAADAPLNSWPAAHDAVKAIDRAASAWPAGGDAARAAEAWKPFRFALADTASAADVLHVIGIWTYIPVNVRLLMRFWQVTGIDAQGNEVVVLEAERLDGALLELAERVSWSRVTERVSSGDCASALEAVAREPVAVTCWVQPAVAVSVTVQES